MHLFLCVIALIFITTADAKNPRDLRVEGDMVKIPAGSFLFGTNKKDVRLLNKSRYRQKMAEAIFRSVVTFKEKYEEPVINK